MIKITSTAPKAHRVELHNRDMTAYLYFDNQGSLFAGGFKTEGVCEKYFTSNLLSAIRKFPELKGAEFVEFDDLDFKLQALMRTVTFR